MSPQLNVDVIIAGTDRGASKVAEGVTKSLGGLESAAKTAGLAIAGITVAGGAALGAGLVVATKAASDFSESASKVGVIFGSATKQIEAFGQSSAAALGLSRAQAYATTGQFGNLFTTMGLGQDAAAGMAVDITKLGADLASFHNIAGDDALDKLRAGLVGESEPLRSMGILLNEASVKAKAMQLGLADANGELSEGAKVQARYALIMEQTQAAQGDFARTSTGLANSTRIISAAFSDMQVQLGEQILPAVAPLVSEFAKNLPAALASTKGALVEAGNVVKTFIGAITGNWQPAEGITMLPLLAGRIGIALRELWAVAQPVLTQFAAVAQKALEGDVGGAFNDLLGMINTKRADLIDQLGKWGASLVEWVAPMIPPLLEQAGVLAERLLAWVGERSPVILAKLGEWGQQLWSWIEPQIPPMLAKAGELATRLLTWVGEQAIVLGDRLVQEWIPAGLRWLNEITPGLLTGLEAFATDTLRWLAEKAPVVAEKFISEWQPKFYEWVAGAAIKILPELGKFLLQVNLWMIRAGPTLALEAGKLGVAIVQGIWDGMAGLKDWLFQKAWDFATGLLAHAKLALEARSPSEAFAREVGEPIVEGIGVGIDRAWPALEADLSQRLDGMVVGAERAVAGIEEAFAGLGSGGGGGAGGGSGSGGGSEPRNTDGQTAPGQYQSDPLYQQLVANKQHGNVPGRLSMDFGDGISYDAATDTYRGERKPHPGKSGYYSVWYRVNSLLTAGHAKSVREALRMAVGWVQDQTDDRYDAGLGWRMERRAAGGPVTAGRPYWVGEAGPELFVPTVGGRVHANGAAPVQVTVNVYGSVTSEQNLVDAIHAGLLRKRQRVASLGLT